VTAPLLDRWSRQSLVQWKQDYDRYLERMQQRCIASGEQLTAIVTSVKQLMNTDLLETQCLYELGKPVDDVTDAEFLAHIDRRIGTVMNGQVPDLDAFFKKHLRFDLREEVVEARVSQYFSDFKSLVRKNGFNHYLGIGNPS